VEDLRWFNLITWIPEIGGFSEPVFA
jgi:hypothetical protein